MINSISYSLEEAEKGILVAFPTPSDLKPQNQYILYFDTPIVLPQNQSNTVSFEPSNGSYSVYGSNTFSPTVFMKIKSLHKNQTKTLLRLIIKDVSNTILYTDYILIICYPQSVVSITGKLLSSNSSNLGPNGGSLLQITGSKESTSSISVGSIISGPGLEVSLNRVSKTTTISTSSSMLSLSDISNLFVGMTAFKQDGSSLGTVTSIDSTANTITLSKTVTLAANSTVTFSRDSTSGSIVVKSIVSDTIFELNQQIGNSVEYSGTYTLTTVVGCSANSTDSTTIQSSLYIILNKENNWTYTVKNQIIAQFIPENDQNLVVFLPVKNITTLAQETQPAPIPEVSTIKLGGRVLSDSVPISNI